MDLQHIISVLIIGSARRLSVESRLYIAIEEEKLVFFRQNMLSTRWRGYLSRKSVMSLVIPLKSKHSQNIPVTGYLI